MLGWELPPFNSGGLGTASLGLTEGLASLDIGIEFVLPKSPGRFPFQHMRVHSAADYTKDGEATHWEERYFETSLGYGNYLTHTADGQVVVTPGLSMPEDTNLPTAEAQAAWYAKRAARLAATQNFDLVHSHDWMTYEAGIASRTVARKRGQDVPLVAHVHATEADRGGTRGGGNRIIAALEKRGVHQADRVVAVSHYTKQMIHTEYEVPLNKISVVHNGIDTKRQPEQFPLHALKAHHKLVLFMGRVTLSKGPDYFLEVARQVCAADPNVRFLLIGSGDMEQACIERAAAMGLTGKVLFSTFLRGKDVEKAYQLADLFVMPSVSEPFGLVVLEAMQNGTPVITSKQSGVVEVSDSMIKVDFWDTEAMSRSVLHVLHNPHFTQELTRNAKHDVAQLSWGRAAEKLHEIYSELVPQQLVLLPAVAS